LQYFIILCFSKFDFHVTVHRDKFLTIKPTRWTNYLNLFLEGNSTCFGQFLCPSSGVFFTVHTAMVYVIQVFSQLVSRSECSCSQAVSRILILFARCQQTCMTYTIAVCTVENSWWWTEELSETCRV
jgi:hypothetical protein